ncbi:MAG: LacI family transcriptional regulator, partial [Mesorhizobium sp.]
MPPQAVAGAHRMMEDRPIRIARGKRVTIADLAREAGVSVA